MKSGHLILIAAGLIVVATAAIILFGFPQPSLHPGGGSSVPGGSASAGGPAPLPSVEIRSYQGKDLSSVNDFHENSIKGPQFINESDYRLTVTGLTNTTDMYTYNEVLGKYPNYTKLVHAPLRGRMGRDHPLGRDPGPGSYPACRARPPGKHGDIYGSRRIYYLVSARVRDGSRHHHGLQDE